MVAEKGPRSWREEEGGKGHRAGERREPSRYLGGPGKDLGR